MGDWSHTHCYEQGTAAGLAGVSMNKLKNLDDGTFCLEELKNNIRGSDIHEPISSLVVIENTHNMAGGKVLPLSFIEDVSKICKENNMKVNSHSIK